MIKISQEMYKKLISDYKYLESENDQLKRKIQALENDKVITDSKHQDNLKQLYAQITKGWE